MSSSMSGGLDPIEEKIIQYVKDNPGKSKSDVVRFLKDRHIAARIATLAHLDKLENHKMIICELENPNSQIYKIYVNKNNKLTSVLVELEEFRAAYLDLLEKSKNIIDKKDYSKEAKIFGFKNTDPAKWEEKDKLRYIMDESEKFGENAKKDFKFLTWRNRSKENLKEIIKQLVETNQKLSEIETKLRSGTDPKREKDIMLKRHKLLSDLEAGIIECKPLLDNAIQSLYDVKNYEVVFLLFQAVLLYYWFVQIIVFRTIFVWPNNIKDSQILSNIYSIVFRIVSEIQVQLLKFFDNNKLGFIQPTSLENIALIIKMIQDGNIKPYYLPQYQMLGMKSEIKSVTNSLLKLHEEIKNYNFIDMSDIEITEDIDKLYEIDNEIKEMLKQVDNSKSIIKIEMSKPEYQNHSQIIRKVVEKIIQLPNT